MSIKISDARDFRKQQGLTHLVIFGVDADGVQHVATHGHTMNNARQAAIAGNRLKAALGWPEDVCKAMPKPRKCANCVYFKPNYGTWTVTGWTRDGRDGYCLVEPAAERVADDHGCRHFEPHA